jgi:hypothetical protein
MNDPLSQASGTEYCPGHPGVATSTTTIDFWNNPLVIHAFESPAGRRKLWWMALGQPVTLIALYAVLAHWLAKELTGGICLVALIGLQVLGGMIGALVLTGAAVLADVRQRTLESLKLTSMTPAQLLLGKLLAEPAGIYLSVWATMPLAAVCSAAADFPLGWVVLTYVNITALMVFAGCLGLVQPLESRSGRPGAMSPARAILAILLLIGVESSIGGYAALVQTQAWQANLWLWGVQVPVPVFIPLVSLLLAGVFFRIAVRRLTQPVLPPVSKPTAYALAAAADVLAGGFLFDVPTVVLGLGPRLAIFWMVHVGLSILLLLAGTASRQAVSSWVWRFRGRWSWHRDLWWCDRSPNDLMAVTLMIMGVVNGMLLVSLPVLWQDGWQMGRGEAAMSAAAWISLAAVILAMGAAIQWLGMVSRQGALAPLVLVALMLLALPYTLVEAPLAFQRPAYPAWLAAASPIYHIGQWFREVPPEGRELLLLLSVYAVLGVSSGCWFHVRLRRLSAAVDRTLAEMRYSGTVLPAPREGGEPARGGSPTSLDGPVRGRSSAGS